MLEGDGDGMDGKGEGLATSDLRQVAHAQLEQ